MVDRYGRYVLLTNRDLDRAEAWYQRHGRWGVFGSRLLPVIRNFVAVPAGVAEVPLVRFGVMTFLGSLIWDGAWALIGYQLGSSWKSIVHGFNDAGYLLLAGGHGGRGVPGAPVAVLQGGHCLGQVWAPSLRKMAGTLPAGPRPSTSSSTVGSAGGYRLPPAVPPAGRGSRAVEAVDGKPGD